MTLTVDRTRRTTAAARLEVVPRDLHPGAWWLWALGLAAAASRTLNPLLLLLILGVVWVVVVARRTDAPWARGIRYFLILGLIVIALRVVFRAILGGAYGPDAHVLLTLPTIALPKAAAGISLGGPVTAESLLAAAYDGLRLATMLVCLGAANSLANPRRMLKSLPGALYEAGMAVVVALSVAPQLIESVLRVRRARRLRENPPRGLHALGGILLPVLEDALDRSLHLAASMDARGYGRRGATSPAVRRRSGVLVGAGLLGVCAGLYGLLGGITGSRALGLAILLAGCAVAIAGMVVGGRHVHRTRYRPDPWRAAEWLVAGSGLLCAAVFFAVGWADPLQLAAVLQPLSWPALPVLPAVAVLLAATPAIWTPVPATRPATTQVTDGAS